MELLNKDYEYFLIIADTENLSRAADILGVQQSGLSKSLRRLEDGLGHSLFVRRHKGLKLTEFGERLRKHLIEVQENWRDEVSKTFGDLGEIRGYFKIGCHSTVAVHTLTKFFPKAVETNRGMQLSLAFDTSAEVTRRVNELDLDLGIVVNPPMLPDLVVKNLHSERAGMYARERNTNVIYYNPDMYNAARVLKKFQEHKLIAVQDYEVCAAMAASGGGAALLPSPVAERWKLKLIGESIADARVCLVYRKDRTTHAALKYLIELVLKANY